MRLRLIGIAFACAFAFLFAGLFYLQIINWRLYRSLAEGNRIRIIYEQPLRGTIYDRNGKALAEDKLSFDIEIVPQEADNSAATLKALSPFLDITYERLIKIYRKNYAAPFAPVTLAQDVDKRRAMAIEENRMNLPGAYVLARPSRRYNYYHIASSMLGYLGEISQDELDILREYGYREKDYLGRQGIEKVFEDYLRGTSGGMQVEVDSLGRQVSVLGFRPASRGKDLYLTIDIKLQQAIEGLMQDEKGAVLVMDTRTGEMLAMVSRPGFDPNMFIRKEGAKIERLLHSPGRPLVNRAISGTYPAGSIFKLAVAYAALVNNRINEQTAFICRGALKIGNRDFECWEKAGHGEVRVQDALARSCNIYFYRTGHLAGADNIAQIAGRLGLGRRVNVELPGELKGFIPTTEWKRKTKGERWMDGDTANLSIGQGYVEVTPIQILKMISVIATGNADIHPHILKNWSFTQEKDGLPAGLELQDSALNVIRNGLRKAVNEEYGTGRNAKVEGLIVAGKTGTAQVAKGEPHSWFCGFAPAGEPKISFVVLIEHGGSGGGEAASVAKGFLEYMKQEGIL